LQLAGHRDPAAREALRAREEVVAANRAAAAAPLEPNDPRWVLALRTQLQLQGSALSPESRLRLQRTARCLGIRPFEANVIMAVVQDQARQGRPLAGATPTLALVTRPAQPPRANYGLRLAVAIGLGVVLALVLGSLVVG
jgi:hypothetical protein